MRKATLSYSDVYYPDELAFAFKPIMVTAENTGAKNIAKIDVSVTHGAITHTAAYYAHGGKVYANIDAFVQSLFDTSSFGVDYSQTVSVANTFIDGVGLDVVVTYDDSTTETAQLSFDALWGAEDYGGESFYALRDVRWWPAFPFTLGVYIGANGTALMNGQSYTINKGVSNIQPPSCVGELINAYTIEGGIIQSTFDTTFDITFQGGGGTILQTARLHVDNIHDEGIYLRWLDRHGFYAYWLFKGKDEQLTTETIRAFLRADFAYYSDVYSFGNGAGFRQAVSRGRILPICAPLVNGMTWDYLADVLSSPLVDMYMGDDNGTPQWMSVGVQSGTWTKTDDDLQDFAINIILPETPVQKL